MKKILILAGIVGLFTACKNISGPKAGSGTIAQFNTADSTNWTTVQWLDTAKNFGKINEGEVVEIEFRVKNSGTKPLVIKEVHPGCGCTVAEKPDEPIAPGNTAVIKGKFDSNGRPGTAHKTMDVTLNTREGRFLLNFEGEVIPKKKEGGKTETPVPVKNKAF